MKWEFDILYALQKIHQPVLDHIMTGLSTIGNAGIFWIVLGLALCIPKKYRKIGIQMVISMAITFIIGNLILKNLIARQRPCWLDTQIALLIKSPKDYSFPSGHSMNGFAASIALLCNDKKLGIPAVILASLIAFSRLYHFVHFPTDVMVGILIGACGLSEREPQTFFVIFNIIEAKNSEAYSFGVFHTIFYLVNSNMISLLRFTNFVIASADNGWLESMARS